jgi:branched-chain amino acid transport system ATP-binding protein
LTASGLSKNFGGFQAVKNVDLRIREESIHGLIGPNGAGKTTCFNLLTKFIRPSSGVIVYRGRDISALSPAQIARLGVVRSFQISSVFARMTALQNVRIGLQRQAGLSYQFWTSKAKLRTLDERAMQLLTAVNMQAYAETLAQDLPYGRKRALELATTLALEPDILLLDEPMAGMGHEDIEIVAELIRAIAKGRTVVMVEHNLSVVEHLCDEVSVLQRGEIISQGSYQTVRNDPVVQKAYIGASLD